MNRTITIKENLGKYVVKYHQNEETSKTTDNGHIGGLDELVTGSRPLTTFHAGRAPRSCRPARDTGAAADRAAREK